MTTIFRKFILGALITALALAALPLTSAFAAGANDTGTPPAPGTAKDPAKVNERLEKIFAREKENVERVGQAVANFETLSKNAQTLIEKAKANGKDVSALQAAFEAYQAAFAKGKPLYEQAEALVRSHSGFDGNGRVTDAEKATVTIKSLADIQKQYRETVGPAFKALREAMQAFREANPRPGKTPTAP